MAAGRDDRVPRRVPPWLPVLITVVVGAVLLVVARGVIDRTSDASDGASSTTSTSTSTTTPPSTSSTTTAPPPEPIATPALRAEPYAESPPAAYRIVYDVVENGLPRTETWTVKRPYASLVVADRDGNIVSGTATSRTQLWTYLSDRDGWFAIQPELHRAAFDQRPLAVMATMVELGYAEENGTTEYAGRGCRRFRVAEPLGTGALSELGGSESTEVCIDDTGLVLHERWRISGTDVSVRTAVSVETDPSIDPSVFDPTPRVDDAPEAEALLAAVAVEADEETLARLRTDIAVPDGYSYDGAVFRSSTTQSGVQQATEIVRFYSAGADLVELAEIHVPGTAELDGGSARPVDVEGFDEVWFDPDFRVSAIRARINETSFVEIRGADPAMLLDLLQSITLR